MFRCAQCTNDLETEKAEHGTHGDFVHDEWTELDREVKFIPPLTQHILSKHVNMQYALYHACCYVKFANQTNAWFKKRKITVYIQCNFVQLVLLWVGLLSYLKHNVLFEIAFTRLPLLLEWLYLLFKIISMWKQTHLNFMFHILIWQICHISYLINNTMFKRNNHWEMHHYLGFPSKKSYKYHMSITAGACTCSSCIHYEV